MRMYGPEISNVDEGIIEGSKDASNAKDEFAWKSQSTSLK
jgi:hypothetical protein